ncbi:MAG: PAS domain S-box protein [Thermodesulfobacteriota bacterium]
MTTMPEQLRHFLNTSEASVIAWDQDSKILFVNKAFEKKTGYRSDEIRGVGVDSLFAFPEHELNKIRIEQASSGVHWDSAVLPIITKEGNIRTFLWSTFHVYSDQDSRLQAIIAQGSEVSGRLNETHDCQISEPFYKALFENVGAGILFVKRDHTILLVNHEFEKLSGYRKEELEGKKNWTSLFAEETTADILAGYQNNCRPLPSHHSLKLETSMRTKAAERRDVILWMSGIPGTDLRLLSLFDITEQKRSEESLKVSEEQYRNLVENMTDTLYRADTSGNITFVSPSGARLLGIPTADELIGRNIAREFYCNPEDRLLFLHQLKKYGRVKDYEVTLKRKDGSPVIVSTNSHFYYDKEGNLLGVEGIFTDITERKHAEAERENLRMQLIQSQKLEAIGTLAGGIAHDFNNILMGIQGRASLLSIDPQTPHPHLEHLRGIESYVKSASDLTGQLLGLARGGKYETKPAELNEIVQESANMFGRTKKEIRIHAKFQEPLVVEVDREQIKQVLLNMFVNAWQAMPNGGDLFIETGGILLSEEFCRYYETRPGWYSRISISDTGIGMDEETRQKIFDPFFTTKEKGRGTGLGLASAYGIIRNHNGMITVRSEISFGSTFHIYLPISKKKPLSEPGIENTLVKGSETILLVDDEEMIIEVTRAILETLGYHVIAAKSGKEACERLRMKDTKIDLVILDMIMPGMDGGTAFNLIREIQPGIPVLLSSGYSINGQANEIMNKGCNGFIQKPSNILELSTKIRSILE